MYIFTVFEIRNVTEGYIMCNL